MSIFYVFSKKGNDQNTGDIDHPLQTLPEAVRRCQTGDTVYVIQDKVLVISPPETHDTPYYAG